MSQFDVDTKRNEFFAQMERELGEMMDPVTKAPRAELVEDVPCPCCGTPGAPLLKKWGFTYDKCPNCTAIFTNPRLKEEVVIQLYRQGSEANEMWAKNVHSSPVQMATNHKYFHEQARFLKTFCPTGGLVDVGCGNGDFLVEARKQGFECLGLELEEKAVAIARSKNLEIIDSLLDDARVNTRRFDALTMFGVLEHLFEPERDLRRIHGLLKDDGIFLGITPNSMSMVGMLLHEEARFYTPRNHPVIFSGYALRKLFERCGFEVVHLDTVLSGYESIVNTLQYREPFGPMKFEAFFPEKLVGLVSNREKFEELLFQFDLGLRLRIVARKKR